MSTPPPIPPAPVDHRTRRVAAAVAWTTSLLWLLCHLAWAARAAAAAGAPWSWVGPDAVAAAMLALVVGGVAHATLATVLRRVGTSAAEALSTMQADASRARGEVDGLLRTLFERSNDGLVICNPSGQVLSCNPAAGRLFDQPPAALVGTDLLKRLQPVSAGTHAPQDLQAGRREVLARRRDDTLLPAELSVAEVHLGGTLQRVVSLRDLSDRRRAQDQLAFMAHYDGVTGLPNRALFRDRLALAMERARRSRKALMLMVLDLDRFKVVNDSLGHDTGDRLLMHVARILTEGLRGTDSVMRTTHEDAYTLSRMGGDEFTVIAENVGGPEESAVIARRLLDALTQPVEVAGEQIVLSASIGIALYPLDNVELDLDGMIRHAEMAMYRSKAMGRGTYSFFSDDLNASVKARLSLETSLRKAIERDEFELHYQPKADLVTGRVIGVEALIRWNRPGHGMVPPDRFIPLLEDTGLIVPVGAWVVRAACAQLAAWDRERLPRLSMAVNLSACQLREPHLPALIQETLREKLLDPGRLELELTESLLMEDSERNRNILSAFGQMGVKVAIDDFGTGHSSLAYLRRFNIDTLKIDRSFVRQAHTDPEDGAIAAAVVALGHSLSMKIVAEGVETEDQASYLRSLGCDVMQGYLLSKPLPAADFAAWLTKRLAREAAEHAYSRETVTASRPMPLISLEVAATE